VARRYGISSGQLYTWRRHLLEGSLGTSAQPVARFARVNVMAMPPDSVKTFSSPQPASGSSSMSHLDGMMEIALPGGIGVRVDAHVSGRAVICRSGDYAAAMVGGGRQFHGNSACSS